MQRGLSEFYSELNYVGVSAATGEGFDEFFTDCVERQVEEYNTTYLEYLELQKTVVQKKREELIDERMKIFEDQRVVAGEPPKTSSSSSGSSSSSSGSSFNG